MVLCLLGVTHYQDEFRLTILTGSTYLCNSFQASHHRASVDSLRRVFQKYASVVSNGEHYMTPKDFVVRFLRLADEENYNEATVECIARAADTSKDGLISFDEFVAFESLLCTPDALYTLAFEMFDRKGQGCLDFGECILT
ncbi:unnamed protein product [Echinostoma caproni]|uniref:EF-hand domain-containing protein n=1 Tax=Echinostoma caproni TaxID=27848 RepID=A0A183AVD6_9TREM|nr:unnamed protein product [Echinostoma caproni]